MPEVQYPQDDEGAQRTHEAAEHKRIRPPRHRLCGEVVRQECHRWGCDDEGFNVAQMRPLFAQHQLEHNETGPKRGQHRHNHQRLPCFDAMTQQYIATTIALNPTRSDNAVFPPASAATAAPVGSTATIAMTAAIPPLFSTEIYPHAGSRSQEESHCLDLRRNRRTAVNAAA